MGGIARDRDGLSVSIIENDYRIRYEFILTHIVCWLILSLYPDGTCETSEQEARSSDEVMTSLLPLCKRHLNGAFVVFIKRSRH